MLAKIQNVLCPNCKYLYSVTSTESKYERFKGYRCEWWMPSSNESSLEIIRTVPLPVKGE